MRGILILGAIALLSGCAGVQRSMEYNSIDYIVVEDPALPHPFWVFDKPDEHRMLVNTGVGAAMGQGFARGMTFGIADTSTPHQHFEAAAQVFLDQSSRECEVERSERVIAPTNYEIFYTCAGSLDVEEG